jgi:hypothetical protein
MQGNTTTKPLIVEAQKRAWQVLEGCITGEGILASPANHDNYRRVWARDSMIAGIAGLLGNNSSVIEAMVQSVITLQKHQAANGQIPSNVGIDAPQTVSFGSLAGRVDATTWWVIGACLLISNQKESVLKQALAQPIAKAFQVLKDWEMNGRGFIYTPLGGNWADEYISEGYNLYDQCLRLWALRIAGKVYENEQYIADAAALTTLIVNNYYYQEGSSNHYHKVAYQKAEPKPYFWFQFGPQGYDTRFDMAANALVLMLDLHPEPARLEEYLKGLAYTQGRWMLPVFYPVIQETDPEWFLLERNYSYSFKNKPHHFHNGGCWPVFMGWLGLGLAKHGLLSATQNMQEAISESLAAEEPPFSFHEYWAGDTNVPGGVKPLAYTATGVVLLQIATQLNCNEVIKKLF